MTYSKIKLLELEPQRFGVSTRTAGKRYNPPAAAGAGRSPGRPPSRPRVLKRNRAMIAEKKFATRG